MDIGRKFAQKMKIISFFIVILGIIAFFLIQSKNPHPAEVKAEVKIAYFHGGRTMLLYRAYINDEFEKEGISVKLITKNLKDSEYYVLSKNYEDIKTKKLQGKARGGELINEALDENADAATPGESSFIEAVRKGSPIVAVAELGHDTKDQPAHAIIFRKDVIVKSPGDIKGKVLNTRRAGAGDKVFLEEFLSQNGLDPQKDVTLIDQVEDDESHKGLINGTFDGGFYHLMTVQSLVKNGDAYVYRKFNWVNPEISQALLVFRKDFVKKHPEEVKNVIRAYMKRIRYEHALPREERLKDPGEGYQKGLQMAKDFQGMNLPQYDDPPLVQIDLLEKMQDLLLKHGALDKKADISSFVDNSFVEEIQKELESGKK